MANNGFWTVGLEGSVDNMNLWLCQYGLKTAQPAFGKQGRRYFATDENQIYLDTGSAWLPMFLIDPAVGIGGLRTLGLGAQQAAAGDHVHP